MGGKRLKITPQNVRGGADRISAENTAVTALAVPDAGVAASGLAGFATAGALPDAHQAMESALKAVGARWEHMAKLCRTTADTFELASMTMPGTVKPPWLSQQIGDGLAAMGDLNRTAPKP